MATYTKPYMVLHAMAVTQGNTIQASITDGSNYGAQAMTAYGQIERGETADARADFFGEVHSYLPFHALVMATYGVDTVETVTKADPYGCSEGGTESTKYIRLGNQCVGATALDPSSDFSTLREAYEYCMSHREDDKYVPMSAVTLADVCDEGIVYSDGLVSENRILWDINGNYEVALTANSITITALD